MHPLIKAEIERRKAMGFSVKTVLNGRVAEQHFSSEVEASEYARRAVRAGAVVEKVI
jgi:hypothetical protein